MKKVDLVYRLDGEQDEISKGLSVFEIAPALLSVGKLITESNKILYPDGKEIAVNVKPFREGSFIIDIVIFAHNNLQQLLHFVNRDDVKRVKELLGWIGLLPSIPLSLYGLIQLLKGSPKSVEPIKANEVRYIANDNSSLTVPNEVHQLFQNCNIQNHFYNGFGKPLEIEEVKKIETYQKNDDKKVLFEAKDAEYLKKYSQIEMPALDPDEVVETKFKTSLRPKRGSFDGDPRQWSFHMGDHIIRTTIKDEAFLKQCEIGNIRPNHRDTLEVTLVQKIKKVNGKPDYSAPVYEIAKVLDYKKGASRTQSTISFG